MTSDKKNADPNDPRIRLQNQGRAWETDMCHAPCNNCPAFCIGALCPCCCAIYLRNQALQGDFSK